MSSKGSFCAEGEIAHDVKRFLVWVQIFSPNFKSSGTITDCTLCFASFPLPANRLKTVHIGLQNLWNGNGPVRLLKIF
jgi:hypothetical protein